MSALLARLKRFYGSFYLLPRTLFARSLLIIAVPVLLLQVVMTVVFVDNHWGKVTSRLSFSVAGEVAILAQQMEWGMPQKKMLEAAKYYAQNLDLLVTFEPERKLEPGIHASGTWEQFTVQALSKSLETQVRRPYSLSFSPDDDWVNIGIQLPDGILRVFVLERRLFSSSAYIFLIWLIGSSLVLFSIAVGFMRNQIRPIRKLAVAAERLGMGRDIPNFKPEGAREVRQAAKAFLDMQERISRQIEQRTAMLAGISHDLRTPLTRLKLGLSMVGDNPEIDALKGDVQDMERMINSYLDFVRGEGKEATVRTDIALIIHKVVEPMRRHGTVIEIKTEGDLGISLRPLAFERCLQNLLSNAEKYGTHIWVSASRIDETILMIIEDDGPGLDPSQYDDVFKPFFRVDVSRNIQTGGVGLGLPIVRDIVHAHGGNIHLERSIRGGLAAVIQIPV
jgi:two-component system osmolarity sensor histidine kinase EnvZ